MIKHGFITISGMMGSGKTTLARGLSSELGWEYIPESPYATRYLQDLFSDPRRWAFETQIAFLIDKAIQLSSTLSSGHSAIVDRSLYEDVEIFAGYFHEKGFIDDRSFGIYEMLARYFIMDLPQPDIVLCCACSFQTVLQRTRAREKYSGSLYPPGHLEAMSELYEQWTNRYDLSPMYAIDSESVDWRQPAIIHEIAEEVKLTYQDLEQASGLELSSHVGTPSRRNLRFLRRLHW